MVMLVVDLPFPSLLLFEIINYQKISENKIYLMMGFKKFDHFFHMISVKSLEKKFQSYVFKMQSNDLIH